MDLTPGLLNFTEESFVDEAPSGRGGGNGTNSGKHVVQATSKEDAKAQAEFRTALESGEQAMQNYYNNKDSGSKVKAKPVRGRNGQFYVGFESSGNEIL